ncbi:MAG: TIGR00701 family protein [Gammaproteobacteria bacterium]|nr:MAG: TIGR00701 family protein [Gammaproteobacteria bacterium]
MLWMKAFHIIAVICWFAGLFYLPRLFVYHAMAERDLTTNRHEAGAIARFKVMERKLYYGITMPAMIATWLSGLWLLYGYAWVAYSSMGWLHTKILLVLLLSVYHFSMGYYYKRFRDDKNSHSHVFYRYYNEVPTLFLLIVVVLVVVKPF